MLRGGREYGCIETGEVTVFLKVEEGDCNTLYYYLAIPKLNVHANKGSSSPCGLTAMGQLLNFVLMAYRAGVRNQDWITEALDRAGCCEEVILAQRPQEETQPGSPLLRL